MHSLALGVVVAILVSAVSETPKADRNAAPDWWPEIEQEVAAVSAGDQRTKHWLGHEEPLKAAARRLARRCDRTAIENLVLGFDAVVANRSLSAAVNSVSLQVIAAIAGAEDVNWVLKERPWGVHWYGAALAAIDAYHDVRSREFLLDFALKCGTTGKKYGWDGFDWENPAVYALGLLRSYTPERIRLPIEGALRAEEGKKDYEETVRSLRSHGVLSWDGYLKALLVSMDYAAELKDPAESDRYRDFERRVWRAWCLAKRGSIKNTDAYETAAQVLAKYSREGDERFLLRIFTEPASTHEEKWIAVYFARRFSADGKKRLLTIALGTSTGAMAARESLLHAARWTIGDPERLRNPPAVSSGWCDSADGALSVRVLVTSVPVDTSLPIPVYAQVRNNTRESLSVLGDFAAPPTPAGGVIVQGPSGALTYKGDATDRLARARFRVLGPQGSPNDKAWQSFMISPWEFGGSETPGVYRIEVHYAPDRAVQSAAGKSGVKDFWVGRLQSQPVAVTKQ